MIVIETTQLPEQAGARAFYTKAGYRGRRARAGFLRGGRRQGHFPEGAGMSLISVQDLTIQFKTDEGLIVAVEDVSFDIAPGEVLGLVGESGSGKSVTAKSLMRLNGANTVYDPASRITLSVPGEPPLDVLGLERERDMIQIRGGAISMVFQEPMASFAPAIRVGDQMVEQLLLHTSMSKKEATALSIEMLDRVGIPEPAKRFRQYAFEFSGGMRQRAMIAMALSAPNPSF